MKALVIGATGATGKDLVPALLNDLYYTKVVVFVRRSMGIKHPKLAEVITDFKDMESLSSSINGDIWFSTLGTTLKTAGSKEKQWAIDYDIPAQFAAIAKRNGLKSAVLLSAYGAASDSRVFYSKMKGQLEDHIRQLGFDQYIIFRPGLLLRKDTDRGAEKTMGKLLGFFNKIGLFKKFRPMPTSVLAGKMAKAPHSCQPGEHVFALNEIFTA